MHGVMVNLCIKVNEFLCSKIQLFKEPLNVELTVYILKSVYHRLSKRERQRELIKSCGHLNIWYSS